MVQFDHAEIARPSSSRLAAFDDSASVIRLTAICAPTVKRRAPEVKLTGRAAPNLPVASRGLPVTYQPSRRSRSSCSPEGEDRCPCDGSGVGGESPPYPHPPLWRWP